MSALLVMAAAIRFRAFDRLGAALAGDRKGEREALQRTATADGAERVARFAAMLSDPEETRLIRWTPARTPEGSRIVLGASPMAWYLWLPEPVVLMRVPDSFVGQMEHVALADGVTEMRCTPRASDDVVTATDGTTVEEADNSIELAGSLLSGLVVADPNRKAAPAPVATPPVVTIDEQTARTPLGAAISIAS